MSDTEFSLSINIHAKDIFRILAIPSIVDTLEEWVCKNIDTIKKNIPQTERIQSTKWHKKPQERFPVHTQKGEFNGSKRERDICKSLLRKHSEVVGTFIDYELPLDESKDSAFGKIDLVSATDDTLFLFEVKGPFSNEPPIRAFMEIFTFWRELVDDPDTDEANSFLEKYRNCAEQANPPLSIPEHPKIQPALLLCKSSPIFQELNDSKHSSLWEAFREIPVYTYSWPEDGNITTLAENIRIAWPATVPDKASSS